MSNIEMVQIEVLNKSNRENKVSCYPYTCVVSGGKNPLSETLVKNMARLNVILTFSV